MHGINNKWNHQNRDVERKMRNVDKYHMLKLLETIAEVSSNKNCNNCDTTTKSNSGNNDSEITSSNNTHLVPQ